MDFLKEEVRKQVNKASAISGCLNSYIWRNKYLRRETKVKIYKTVVRPVMTETRSVTVKTKQMLNITEMNVLRKVQSIQCRNKRNLWNTTYRRMGLQEEKRME